MKHTEKHNKPKLRFPEFSEAWDPILFGDIYKFLPTNSLSRSDLDECATSIANIHYGDIHTRLPSRLDLVAEALPFVKHSKIEIAERQEAIKMGDLIFADASEDAADIGKMVEITRTGPQKVVSGLHTIHARLKRHDDVFVGFCVDLFKSPRARRAVVRESQGAKVLGISSKKLASIELHFPKRPEQEKIATFLASVDKKIDCLSNRLELLKEYKTGCSQKIFSQETRFTDSLGNAYRDWQETRLGEIATLVGGLTYSPSDVRKNGMLVLRSSNVQAGELAFEDNVYVDLDVDEDKKTKVGDILLCVRNGSRNLIGKNAIVRTDVGNTTHGAFMTVLRGDKNGFLHQLLQTPIFFKEVHKNLGATINSINGNDLRSMKFLIPSDDAELEKVANFLGSIDEKISLATKELQLALAFKKGLIQQMFV